LAKASEYDASFEVTIVVISVALVGHFVHLRFCPFNILTLSYP